MPLFLTKLIIQMLTFKTYKHCDKQVFTTEESEKIVESILTGSDVNSVVEEPVIPYGRQPKTNNEYTVVVKGESTIEFKELG